MKERAIGGFLWLVSGTAARAAVRILVVAILARLLAPEDFGLIGAAGIVIAFSELFSTSGIIMPLVHRRTIHQQHISTAFTVNTVIGLITLATVLIIAPWLGQFFRMPELTPIVQALSLLFPLQSISAVAQKLLERDLIYQRIASIDFISYVFGYAAIALIAAALGVGVWALVSATLGSASLRTLLLYFAQPHPLRFSFRWSAYVELMRTGAGFGLIRIFNVAALKGDYAVVGRWMGSVSLGFYERAYVLMDLANILVSNALSTVLFPAFARLRDDPPALAIAYLRSSALLALLICPLSTAASILAPEIIELLLGRQWISATAPFQILAFGMFFRTGYRTAAMLANGLGVAYRSALIQAIYAGLVIGGALVAIPHGIRGVAISTLIALGAVYILLTSLALKLARLRWIHLGSALMPALFYTAISLVVTLCFASLFRYLSIHPALVLIFTGAILTLIMTSVGLFVRSTLGAHGRWLMDLILSRLRNALPARQPF